MNSNASHSADLGSKRAKIASGVLTVCATVFLASGMASAQDSAVVTAATDGGTEMADTLRSIGMALIPLAIGVLVVRKGWTIVRGFF